MGGEGAATSRVEWIEPRQQPFSVQEKSLSLLFDDFTLRFKF
jgi:hypothetical protein